MTSARKTVPCQQVLLIARKMPLVVLCLAVLSSTVGQTLGQGLKDAAEVKAPTGGENSAPLTNTGSTTTQKGSPMEVQGPASPWRIYDESPAFSSVSFDLVTGDSPATDVQVSASTLTGKAGDRSIDAQFLSVCKDSCAAGCSSPSIAAHTRARLLLCASPDLDARGAYEGSVIISSREYPAGVNVKPQLKVFATSSGAQTLGAMLLLIGIVLGWIIRTYLSNRVARDQALFGVALQRQRAQALLATAGKLGTDFGGEEQDILAYLSDLMTRVLTVSYVEGQLFVSPSIPLPFQFTPRATQFATFLNQVDAKLTLLTILVSQGLSPIEALWNADTQKPAHQAAFQQAVRAVNALFVANTDASIASRSVLDIINALKTNAGVQPPAAAAAAAPQPPSVEAILIDLRRISVAVWLCISMLTLLAGIFVLILNNPGFGTAPDLVYCMLWGFGLPTAIQSITPNSVLNSLAGSTMRVSAVA